MRHADTKRRGMTLIEILIAMAIASAVLLCTATVFMQASSASERTYRLAELTSQCDAMMALLSRDIMHMSYPVDPSRASVEGWASVRNQAAALLRLRTNTLKSSLSSPGVVDYFLITDKSLKRPLVRRVERIRCVTDANGLVSSTANGNQISWEVLLENVEEFSLRYYDGTVWTQEWVDRSTAIPSLIEVTVRIDEPELSKSEATFRRCFRPVVSAPFAADSTATEVR